MQYVFGSIIFLLGAALGSFIAVIVDRYNTGLPFFKGRSFCFSCDAQLQNKDLVPIFSFIFLWGKCRHCQSKIPVSAFVTEIIMGVLSVLVVLKVGIFDNFQFSIFNFQTIFNFLILTAIFANILLISAYDLRHFIIPDSFLISLFIFSFLYLSFLPSLNLSFFFPSLLFSILLTLPFLLIFLFSRGRWLGFGDVKYISILGFLLGFAAGLSAVVLAFWIGAAFSICALLLKKFKHLKNLPSFLNNLTIKSEVPFGPFLSLGAVISFCLNLDLFKINELFF